MPRHEIVPALEERLVELERAFWTGDAELYRRKLTEDCLMVFSEVGALGRAEAIAGIASGARWREVRMSALTLRMITEDVVVLSYAAEAERDGDDEPYRARVGSVYAAVDGEWKLAFHQHTVG